MERNKKPCDLTGCFLCRLCQQEWQPAIQAARKTFTVKKGEMLFKEGDTMTGIYFVNTGIVKVHKKWGREKELIVRIARNTDIVGHRGLGKDIVYPVSATALVPSTVCYIDLDFFRASLKTNYDFIYWLMLFYADELKTSERKMNNLAHMPVKGRIALALLDLKENFGLGEDGFLALTLSRQDLASYAGTTYETVFRILNEFALEKAVKLAGKSIGITNAEKLLHYTTGADGD